MELLLERELAGGHRLEFAMTDATDVDLSTVQAPEVLDSNQQSLVDGPWSWLRQVHSDRTMTVTSPGEQAGSAGDALVSAATDAVLAVQVADCVPVGLYRDDGTFAVAHAGWRGALCGVLESATRSMRASGGRDGSIAAVIGPHICASCYEFGDSDLAAMAQRFGPGVQATTQQGTPGLDMGAVVQSELARLGVSVEVVSQDCTSCSGTYWSHRARAERGRQALIAVVRPA